jgi:tetratricopeptide (TPR) repeat protein
MKLSSSLVATLFGTVIITLVQPYQKVVSQPATQLATTARQITVLIEGQNLGSGIIIKREGNTYTVLTARHVVAIPNEYTITTPDGHRTQVNYASVKTFPGVDLATLEFTSAANYTVAILGNSRTAPSGTAVYVAGFPAPTAAITQSIFNFTEGKITANAERPLADGYALVYSNNTLPGMSGGPLLNGSGEVIGIHGRGDTESAGTKATANPNIVVKTGFNLAIPINTYLSLSSNTGVTGFVAPESPQIPNQLSADDFYLQAGVKLNKRDYRSAIADYDQAIRLRPNYANAFTARGSARYALRDFQGALTDYNQAIRLDSNNAQAYANRGGMRNEVQKDFRGAILDLDRAIRLDPNNAVAYNNRAIVRYWLRDYRGSIADADQVIRLDPVTPAAAYATRGASLWGLGDLKGALVEYDRSIRLEPNNYRAYSGRGSIRYYLRDRKGAVTDWQKSASLARAQGDTAMYNDAMSNLRLYGR